MAGLYAKRGMVHHAIKLRDPEDPLHADFAGLIRQHSKAYGIEFDIQTFAGFTRGFSVLHYFLARPHLLKGRHIAHVGPEPELRGWVAEMAEKRSAALI